MSFYKIFMLTMLAVVILAICVVLVLGASYSVLSFLNLSSDPIKYGITGILLIVFITAALVLFLAWLVFRKR